MKKFIMLLVAFSLVFGSLAFAEGNGSTQGMEKISHPNEIQNFMNIIRKGTALWGHRKNPVLIQPQTITCVGTAMDTKDTAVKTAMTTYATSFNAAIDARNTCQKAALNQTTAQTQADANKVCLQAFKTSAQTANKALAQARKDAWTKYTADLKVCGQLQTATGTTPAQPNIQLQDGDTSTN